jgi:hypothetical protein
VTGYGNVLSVEKSNLGRIDVPALTYRIDGAEIAIDEGMAGAGLLVWTGETDRRVRDIMADRDGERADWDDHWNGIGWPEKFCKRCSGPVTGA